MLSLLLLQTSEKEMMRKELAGSATADISGASEEVRQEPLLGTALRQAGLSSRKQLQ